MKKIVLGLLLAIGLSASAATVNVSNGASVDPMNHDPARYVDRADNPTAPEIAAFKAGALDGVRFTSTAPVLESAELSLDECSQAVSVVCGTLTETPMACRVTVGVACVGQCSNGVVMRITN